jgi:hypothetical protein
VLKPLAEDMTAQPQMARTPRSIRRAQHRHCGLVIPIDHSLQLISTSTCEVLIRSLCDSFIIIIFIILVKLDRDLLQDGNDAANGVGN